MKWRHSLNSLARNYQIYFRKTRLFAKKTFANFSFTPLLRLNFNRKNKKRRFLPANVSACPSPQGKYEKYWNNGHQQILHHSSFHSLQNRQEKMVRSPQYSPMIYLHIIVKLTVRGAGRGRGGELMDIVKNSLDFCLFVSIIFHVCSKGVFSAAGLSRSPTLPGVVGLRNQAVNLPIIWQ